MPVRGPDAVYDRTDYVQRFQPPRPDLEALVERDLWANGVVFLCGPPGNGKTYLWNNVLDHLAAPTQGSNACRVVRIDLGPIVHLAAAAALDEIAESVVAITKADTNHILELSRQFSDLPWTRIFTRWLERSVLTLSLPPIVLAFDCPPTKEGQTLRSHLYSRLSSWLCDPARSPQSGERRRIMGLVAHDHTHWDAPALTASISPSFSREVPELTDTQVEELVLKAAPWTVAEIADVRYHIGNHPYLWKLTLHLLHREDDAMAMESILQHASEGTGPFADYFDRRFGNIRDELAWTAGIRGMLQFGAIPTAEMTRRLRDAGILAVSGHKIRNRSMEAYFRRMASEKLQ